MYVRLRYLYKIISVAKIVEISLVLAVAKVGGQQMIQMLFLFGHGV